MRSWYAEIMEGPRGHYQTGNQIDLYFGPEGILFCCKYPGYQQLSSQVQLSLFQWFTSFQELEANLSVWSRAHLEELSRWELATLYKQRKMSIEAVIESSHPCCLCFEITNNGTMIEDHITNEWFEINQELIEPPIIINFTMAYAHAKNHAQIEFEGKLVKKL